MIMAQAYIETHRAMTNVIQATGQEEQYPLPPLGTEQLAQQARILEMPFRIMREAGVDPCVVLTPRYPANWGNLIQTAFGHEVRLRVGDNVDQTASQPPEHTSAPWQLALLARKAITLSPPPPSRFRRTTDRTRSLLGPGTPESTIYIPPEIKSVLPWILEKEGFSPLRRAVPSAATFLAAQILPHTRTSRDTPILLRNNPRHNNSLPNGALEGGFMVGQYTQTPPGNRENPTPQETHINVTGGYALSQTNLYPSITVEDLACPSEAIPVPHDRSHREYDRFLRVHRGTVYPIIVPRPGL